MIGKSLAISSPALLTAALTGAAMLWSTPSRAAAAAGRRRPGEPRGGAAANPSGERAGPRRREPGAAAGAAGTCGCSGRS